MANKAKKQRERRRELNARLAQEQTHEEQQKQKAVRRMRDDVLERMLDEHMMDSLEDISSLYHRLASALGAKSMRFEETVGHVQTSAHKNDLAAGLAMRLSGWHNACRKHGLESSMISDMVSEATSQNRLALRYKMRITHVRAHIRACLCVWSLFRKRCDGRELRRVLDCVPVSTRTRVMRSYANKPAITAIATGLR